MQGVEEEMRLELQLQGVQLGLHQLGLELRRPQLVLAQAPRVLRHGADAEHGPIQQAVPQEPGHEQLHRPVEGRPRRPRRGQQVHNVQRVSETEDEHQHRARDRMH